MKKWALRLRKMQEKDASKDFKIYFVTGLTVTFPAKKF